MTDTPEPRLELITPPYGPKPDVAGVAYDQMDYDPMPDNGGAWPEGNAEHERLSDLPQPTPPEPLSDKVYEVVEVIVP